MGSVVCNCRCLSSSGRLCTTSSTLSQCLYCFFFGPAASQPPATLQSFIFTEQSDSPFMTVREHSWSLIEIADSTSWFFCFPCMAVIVNVHLSWRESFFNVQVCRIILDYRWKTRKEIFFFRLHTIRAAKHLLRNICLCAAFRLICSHMLSNTCMFPPHFLPYDQIWFLSLASFACKSQCTLSHSLPCIWNSTLSSPKLGHWRGFIPHM